MAKSQRFPRTLYKKSENGKLSFTNKKHRDIRYDSLIVEDEKEQEAAEEMGYIDSFEDALFHADVREPEVKKDALPNEF